MSGAVVPRLCGPDAVTAGGATGLRLVTALAAAALLTSALVLAPDIVRRFWLSSGAELSALDLACLAYARATFALLGGAYLGVALGWSHLFARTKLAPSVLLLVPGGVCALVVLMKLRFLGNDPTFYSQLTREDAIAEWLTFTAYLAAGVHSLRIARALLRSIDPLRASLFGLLGVALILVAMEEISWGQRLLGVETPEAFAANTQRELTIHNLPAFQHYLHRAYIAVGLVAASAWILVPRLRRVPALSRFAVLAPPWYLAGWFLPVALLYAVYETTTPLRGNDGSQEFFGCYTWNDQEIAELLLAVGFLLFVAIVHGRELRIERRARAVAGERLSSRSGWAFEPSPPRPGSRPTARSGARQVR